MNDRRSQNFYFPLVHEGKNAQVDEFQNSVNTNKKFLHVTCLAVRVQTADVLQASDLREKFEANRHLEDLDVIDRMLDEEEARFGRWRHPDPYIVPWAPGGSKFCRNPAPPSGIDIVYDFGKEDND